jgi:hypothetical protein
VFLVFGFCRLQDKHLIGGDDLDSVDYLTSAWVDVDWSDFFMAYWGDWRKVSFNDQRRRSFKMAATAAILEKGFFQ